MKPSDFLTELSTEKLAQYKTAAGTDASKADKEKDFARGNKRFSGIVKATKKQFANDSKKTVEEGWKEGVGYTVLAGLLSVGAINRLSDLVNSAATGEQTKVPSNWNSGINKINAIKTTTGQGIESIKSLNGAGDKKFEMTLTDGRRVIFTATDLEKAKQISAARKASEPVEVKEQDVAEARGMASVNPYVELMQSLGWFMSMNTATIQQDAVDSMAQQELKSMQQQFRKPIINGKSFSDVIGDPAMFKHPKVAPVLLKFAYDILGYIEPRIKKYIRPELQSKWMGSLAKLKDQYRAAIQFTSGQQGVAEDKDPCWNGYKQIGTKKKGSKQVPNCVPVKESAILKGLRG